MPHPIAPTVDPTVLTTPRQPWATTAVEVGSCMSTAPMAPHSTCTVPQMTATSPKMRRTRGSVTNSSGNRTTSPASRRVTGCPMSPETRKKTPSTTEMTIGCHR